MVPERCVPLVAGPPGRHDECGLQNLDMVAEEAIQADIGREVGVSRPTALEWHRKGRGTGDGEKVMWAVARIERSMTTEGGDRS